jgi:hypothetical protein
MVIFIGASMLGRQDRATAKPHVISKQGMGR